ncbi:Aaa-atpase [Thalictrum thalictroides]|uniref:Aaa-atpase n=1 Tax=Thalictrum thalictroides TaxID=46969 RepID=A0A7J6V657_THATH|nr:Aaa-atpase [Thalictrum thalictroides]
MFSKSALVAAMEKKGSNKMFSNFGSTLASFLLMYATISKFADSSLVNRLFAMIKAFLFPQIRIVIPAESGYWKKNTLYLAVETYLRANASAKAKSLKAIADQGGDKFKLKLDENESITDKFGGAVIKWGYYCQRNPTSNHYEKSEKHYYTLNFSKCHRDLVVGSYLKHIVETSHELSSKYKQRMLYSNSTEEDEWTKVVFKHPAKFDTLAMDTNKKNEIINDLTCFRNSKNYYAKIGKTWKRGYLLYGPPGTGKSTMIAAMANFLEYDIYDLELTAVKNNVSLRRLLTNTAQKAIIVIEDIDCSLALTGDRESKKKKKSKSDMDEDKRKNTVTLSGLLNFIDGLWSACGEERIVVFTTNHVDKLDPALIRRGRMDMHIELSYCSYEAFKVLAKNYLDIDSHPLFNEIGELLKTKNITPADVAEVLICNTTESKVSRATERLEELVAVLKKDQKQEEKDATEEKDETEEQGRVKSFLYAQVRRFYQ